MVFIRYFSYCQTDRLNTLRYYHSAKLNYLYLIIGFVVMLYNRFKF
ncbi:hypothetical protein RPMD05_17 [Rhodobacteraceae phage LS06-2018-MD05]|nr:hypothetical protein RPMD05_17 [Rhodobacteraceae phage LS06-2018-MD05]